MSTTDGSRRKLGAPTFNIPSVARAPTRTTSDRPEDGRLRRMASVPTMPPLRPPRSPRPPETSQYFNSRPSIQSNVTANSFRLSAEYAEYAPRPRETDSWAVANPAPADEWQNIVDTILRVWGTTQRQVVTWFTNLFNLVLGRPLIEDNQDVQQNHRIDAKRPPRNPAIRRSVSLGYHDAPLSAHASGSAERPSMRGNRQLVPPADFERHDSFPPAVESQTRTRRRVAFVDMETDAERQAREQAAQLARKAVQATKETAADGDQSKTGTTALRSILRVRNNAITASTNKAISAIKTKITEATPDVLRPKDRSGTSPSSSGMRASNMSTPSSSQVSTNSSSDDPIGAPSPVP